jgi:DNA-binding response OmpR family regulator
VVIGDDASLGYLIGRYAETSGCHVHAVPTAPTAAEICALKPAAVLFPSVENLAAAQSLVNELANCDIPLLVCSFAADEARGRELGADYCLLYPVTYDSFLAALTATSTMIHEEHEGPQRKA